MTFSFQDLGGGMGRILDTVMNWYVSLPWYFSIPIGFFIMLVLVYIIVTFIPRGQNTI